MIEITTLEVTAFAQNARLIIDSSTAAAVVVDPGGDVQRIQKELSARRLSCAQIWLTHSHLDHCGGVRALKDATGAELWGHPEERPMREMVEQIAAMYGLPLGDMQACPEPEHYLTGGEKLEFGGVEFKVLFTPGHSPGHVCFYAPQQALLIAGDTLFAGSIGRTDLPGGDHQLLLKSIREQILTLPDETRVLSGHGPDTTVGSERGSNPFLSGVL